MKKIIAFILLLFSLCTITSCQCNDKLEEYKVSFASNGGSIIEDATIKEGIILSEPKEPVKEGYTFGGWYKDYDLTVPFKFGEDITSNITLYAKWIPNVVQYTIFFNTNEGKYVSPITVNGGEKLDDLPLTFKNGYEFVGWYLDENFNELFKLDTIINSDMLLHAKYAKVESNKYVTINFITNCNQNIDVKIILQNSKIDNIDVLYKKGYEFKGWYLDSNFEYLFDINQTITSDITLYAKWEEIKYTITYVTNGGTEISESIVSSLEKTIKPKDPIKEGYKFKGWYMDSKFEKEFEFNQHITSDITLYAKWEEIKYTITYVTNGGTKISESVVSSLEKPTKPKDPIKEGYDFKGWYLDSKFEKEFEFNQYITSDITLYAKWEEIIIKSSDATLKELYINGDSVGIISSQFEYNYTLSSGKRFVIFAKANDVNAKIVGEKEYIIEIGNYITVTLEVIAEDNTKLIYTINITTNDSSDNTQFLYCKGLFESIGLTLIDNNYNEVKAYYRKTGTSIYTQVDQRLVRLENGVVRVDVLGLPSGQYDVKVVTSNGENIIKDNILVMEHDRSGYAFFDTMTNKIGAYNEDGSLKSDADVIYVTNETKNTVSYNGKIGLVNILNSLKNVSKPVCIRIIGSITTNQFTEKSDEPRLADGSNYTNEELVAFATNTYSTKYGENLVGLTSRVTIQGYKNIVHTTTKTSSTITESNRNSASTAVYSRDTYPNVKGKVVFDDDSSFNMVNITSNSGLTIEGVGTNAEIFQWGMSFNKSSNVEVRNLTFTNAPEDACSFNGGSNSDNNYYGFWVHNNTFNKGYNSWDITGERDKYNGDGSIDLRYVHGVTLSYNKFNNTHKTGLVGGGDGDIQYNITFHHNYYYNVNSRLPLGRQANMHIYNNYYYNCSSTLDIRANAYVLTEGNYFEKSRTPKVKVDGSSVSAVKSFNDVFDNCNGSIVVSIVNKREEVIYNTNTFSSTFDTNTDLFYYDPINKKSDVMILTDAYQAKEDCIEYAGVLKME